MSGDKIHFQKVSTWVNSYYSKSICFDGENFHAKVRLCAEWQRDDDDRRCVAYKIVDAVQPQESTRERCAARSGGDDDDRCTEWETVRYFQSENKTVTFYADEDSNQVAGKVSYTIKSCN